MLEQNTRSMNNTLNRLFHRSKSVMETLNNIKSIYEFDWVENLMQDGTLPYPAPGVETVPGMKLEFR